LNQGARTARTHFFRRTEARAALAALCLLVGCDVYNQGLLDGAIGDAGGSGLGARGGSSTTGGTSGSAGNGGLFTGGTSGAGAVGGAVSTGGSQGGGGSSGEGGEGDQDSGGTSGGGQGGTSTGGASGDSGTAGQGGMPGGSGGAGNTGGGVGGDGAGTSGAGGGGGAGSGGGAGTGGSSEVCTGCARLSVPLAATADQAHFTITLPAATDFSAATIALRVARYAGTGGWFKAYIQEGSPNFLYQDSVETTIASIGTSMQTISWDVATAGTTADKTIIRRIGIEISGNGASSWTNPTVLYVDSITVTGTTLAMSSFTFDTSNTVSTTPTGSGPNNVIWLNNFSGDTNVTGATLSWLGP
jgi:hypothetical protein